jgi:hypothetical protein
MKSVPIWLPRVEFYPVTHLFQADMCRQGERHPAAVSVQPIGWVMVFLKQARSRWSAAVWQQTCFG